MSRTAHKAKYVYVEPGRVLQNALVTISDTGRISRIESWHNRSANSDVDVVDWGSAVILPGLINAHAHLELTSLHRKLTRFDSFTDWISQLISRRRLWKPEDFVASARKGARLSLASGTTLVGDITSSGVGWKATWGFNLRRVVFEEVLALSADRAGPILRDWNHLCKRSESNPLLIHGISPHAPYSVSSGLYARAAQQARARGMPLATHLAESRAELQFLKDGTGEFRDFLSAANVLPKGWKPPESAPVTYLDGLGVLGPSCLLIHCNYLDRASIEKIKRSRSSVVYCPRSHAFFGHEKHPIRELLDAGINVALGTDSLASNSSLSMIDEMRYLYGKRRDLKSGEIFQTATANGAKALGLGRNLGRLRRGYWADLTILGIPSGFRARHLFDQILEGAGECSATIVQGRISWQKMKRRQFPSYSFDPLTA